jgi:hypothetical protein
VGVIVGKLCAAANPDEAHHGAADHRRRDLIVVHTLTLADGCGRHDYGDARTCAETRHHLEAYG